MGGREGESRRRVRDPAAAREAILAAGLAEFGAHGFAGARTAAIAARAGVSTQLITHHFGGKRGVLDELRRRWWERITAFSASERPLRAGLSEQMARMAGEPAWPRLALWRSLEAGDEDGAEETARLMEHMVEKVRREQEDGTLDPEADPRFVALLAQLLAFAPFALAGQLAELTGDVSPEEYREWALAQLFALLRP